MTLWQRILAILGVGREATPAASIAPVPQPLPPAAPLPTPGQVAPSSAGIPVAAIGDPPPPAVLLVTPSIVQALFPDAADPAAWAAALTPAMARRGIAKPARAAAFLAQVGHETGGLVRMVESFDYSADRLRLIFGAARIGQADADRLGRKSGRPARQEELANILYGGAWGAKNLGNTEPGDGWRFRGRGLIQLTGRDNYTRAASALGIALSDLSAWLETRRGASEAAAWWWEMRGLNALADAGEFDGITRRINAGMAGAEERRSYLRRAQAILLSA